MIKLRSVIEEYDKARQHFNCTYRGKYAVEYIAHIENNDISIYFYNLENKKYFRVDATINYELKWKQIYSAYVDLLKELNF